MMTNQSFKALSNVADAAISCAESDDGTALYMAMRLAARGDGHASSRLTFKSLATVGRAARLAHQRDDGTRLYMTMRDVHAQP
jgi:hypothetical protein